LDLITTDKEKIYPSNQERDAARLASLSPTKRRFILLFVYYTFLMGMSKKD
jgi:hypothetical protein